MRTGILAPAFAMLALTACGGSDEQVYRGADGEEVRVERNGEGTMTFRGEDGEAVVTTGDLGLANPAGLPPYPGADTRRGVNIDASGRDGGSGQISSFQTNDSPAEVISFYRNALESGGYEITATMDMGQSQMITANREGNRDAGVHISATSTGNGETTVSVIAGEGG